MNREDAIITLTNTASLLRDGTRYMKPEHEKQFREAYEMAIKALKQPEPCVDTIDALNESIKHFDDLAEECRRNANIERNDYMDMRDDAAEYRQLSIWLNELKWLRERFQSQPEIIRCEDCMHNGSFDTDCPIDWAGKDYCNFAERRTDESN